MRQTVNIPQKQMHNFKMCNLGSVHVLTDKTNKQDKFGHVIVG